MNSLNFLGSLFSLTGKVAVVTGGTSGLGRAMGLGLAKAGVQVGVLGRRENLAAEVVAEIEADGGQGLMLTADVMERDQLEAAKAQVIEKWGRIDILVNSAGAHTAASMVQPDEEFFDLSLDAMQQIVDLNLMGTVLSCQIFGETMARQQQGSIVNISSLSVQRALTRAISYSASKAAVENFTRWLAIEMANKYGEGVRVNALTPGFFVTDLNRKFMVYENGQPTSRGQAILDHTPMKRYGDPNELVGALIWLCSPSASFVTGTAVSVDGGYGAFSGV